MRVAMLVASEEATSGSVIANAERISARSNGSSHSPSAASLPNWSSTSMLPVSGAAQFRAAGASWIAAPGDLGERRVLEVGQPRAGRPGQERVPQPALAGLRAERLRGRVPRLQAHGSSSSAISRANTASAGCTWVVHEVEQLLPQLLGARVPAEVHQSRLPVRPAVAIEPVRDQGLHHRRRSASKPVADGLAVHVPVVDALEDHRELEAGQRLVEAEVTEVAAGARRIPLHESSRRREAGRRRRSETPAPTPSAAMRW